MKAPAIVRNRFFAVPTSLAAVVLAWNIYVGLHSGGTVEGRVIGSDGRPIADAQVVLSERDLTSSFVERQRASTGPDGRFRFDGQRSHQIRLDARTWSGRRAPAVTIRLWFRAQDVVLQEPLVVGGT